MNYFKKITEYILNIKDNLKILQISNIRINDLENYQKILEIFSTDKFRCSIRDYREINGKENLSQELKLVLSGIRDFSKFYKEHQIHLNAIDTSNLLSNLLKPIELEEQSAYRKILPVNKSITELEGNYESTCFKHYQEHPKSLSILNQIEILKREKKQLKNVYLEWYETREELIKKYSNLLSFKFYDVFQKLQIIEEIIKEDYLENIEVLNLNFNDELLDIINKYFTPTLNALSAKDFFNEPNKTVLQIKKKKMSDTKLYFLIDSLAGTIKDETQREKWINMMLNYFDKKRVIYDKKKSYEKSIYKEITSIELKEKNFVHRVLKGINKV